MTSKNNPSRRNRQQQEKIFDGKKVKPVLYVGSHVGHGRYMATQEENGKLVIVKVDRNTHINLSKTAIAGLTQHVTDEDLEQPA